MGGFGRVKGVKARSYFRGRVVGGDGGDGRQFESEEANGTR